MGAFNTVSGTVPCPSCGAVVDVEVQFKYGNTWQFAYKIGEKLRWGGLDVGGPGLGHVVVDGVVEQICPKCALDEWEVYVHVENDRIIRIENANGRYDFIKLGSSYFVVA
jgi:hypothetical protein